MMKNLVSYILNCLVCFIFCGIAGYSINIFGQDSHKIDSLNQVLAHSKDDRTRCSAYSSLAYIYLRSDFNKATSFNQQALKLAQKVGDNKLLADAWFDRSGIQKMRGDYDQALYSITKAKNFYASRNDTNMQVECMSETGILYQLKNDPVSALQIFMEVERTLLASGKLKHLSKLYSGMGSLYLGQKNYPKAKEYFHKSLKINQKIGFTLGESVNLLNLGNTCFKSREYDKAIDFTSRALMLKEKLHDMQGIQICNTNLGAIYANLGQAGKALEFHLKTLDYALKTNNKHELATAYINIGFDHFQSGHYQEAVRYSSLGLNISDELKNLHFQAEAVRILSESYPKLNNYSEAYRFQKLYKLYSDSIFKEQNSRTLKEIQEKYETAKKENEINALKISQNEQKLQLQNLRTRNLLFIALLLLISLGLVFFFYRNRVNRKISLRLKEINEQKSRFFANLSHEFRTPLTLMIGPAEKLLESASENERPWLELIRRNASRLLFLDEQLLEFTRLDSGVQKLKLVSGNIILAARIIADSFNILAEKKQIHYEKIFPDEPVKMYFDPDILEKTAGNLLSNAFKYTPEGKSITFRVITDFVDNEAVVRFIISDTGIGIPADRQEMIFERFYQLIHHSGNTFTGAGIGLALTRELIELHHGAVNVESEEGKGSNFTITLPAGENKYSREELDSVIQWDGSGELLRPVDTGESFTRENVPAPEENQNLKPENLTILLVEDNPDMRQYVRDILAVHYNVAEAADGDAGLAEAISLVPDLIVTDIMMDGMDGFELCNQLRDNKKVSHIPVIMLTALHTLPDRIKGLETGADDYLSKPFNGHELLARIRNLIQQRMMLKELFRQEFRIEPSAPPVASADARFIGKLIGIVEKNMDNPDFDVNILSDSVGLSRSQLHRRLTAITGQPATGFIRTIRMKRAAQLLKQQSGNISEVMYAVGFDNLSYFSKCFREIYQVSPGEYLSKNG